MELMGSATQKVKPQLAAASEWGNERVSNSCLLDTNYTNCYEVSDCLRQLLRQFVSLSAGGFGCGDDFVEARITAQIIPARIEA
jgi:hypothetical protein